MQDTLKIVKEADELRNLKGNISKSVEILRELGEEIKDEPLLSYDYPMILKKVGVCYLDLGHTEKAKESLQEALEVAKKDFNRIEMADIHSQLALLELYTDSVEKALEYAKKAWEYIGKKRGDKFAQTKVHTATILGKIYFEQGRYSKAMGMYERALSYAEVVDYRLGILTVVMYIADIYQIIDEKPKKAEDLLGEYVEEVEDYKIILPEFLLRLSRLAFERGDLPEAKSLGKRGLRLAKTRKALRQIASLNQLLGEIYADFKQEKADAYFKVAFDSYNEGGYNMPTAHPKEKDWFTDFEDI